jgi:hypothetical protein
MLLDVLEINRLFHSIDLKNATTPSMNQGIVMLNPLHIALEMTMINNIKPRNSRKEPNVRFSNRIALFNQKRSTIAQHGFNSIKSFKDPATTLLIRALLGRESSLVYPVVNQRLDKIVNLVDLGEMSCRRYVDVRVLRE